ncbi:MAG: TPM domain-containing protein [Clostridia bacterium]|nr:TPM domain-containing protein [Clostridia bacterium]
MNKRRIFCIVIALILVLITSYFLAISVNALWAKKNQIPIPMVQKDIYVYDEDNIIDKDIEKYVNALLVQLEEKTGAEIAVITVTSLLGMEIEDYSYELANTLGIGKAEDDNGVLLLISKADNRVRLEIGKGLEGCLPDSKCGRILDDFFVPYREKDEYSEGTKKTIEAVVSVIAKEYDAVIGEIDSSIATEIEEKQKKEEEASAKVIIIIVIIIICAIAFDVIFLDGVFLSAIFSGSSSGSSSGGFGGGSFGGGSFGGGGASR